MGSGRGTFFSEQDFIRQETCIGEKQVEKALQTHLGRLQPRIMPITGEMVPWWSLTAVEVILSGKPAVPVSGRGAVPPGF